MIDILPLSLFFCFLLWASNKFLKFDFLKNKRISPQTFHKKSTSRLGGIAIFFSLFLVVNFIDNTPSYNFLRTALLCSLPVFFIGLLDDLKFNMPPYLRMLLMVPTPVLFFYILDVRVESVAINIIDDLLRIELIGLAFLIFAVIGIINAFNIIDFY